MPTSWIDALATLLDLPPIVAARQADEPPVRHGFSVRRAGMGVWAAAYFRHADRDPRMAALRAWKADPAGRPDISAEMAAALASLIRAWSPVLPADWIVTAPPAGASAGAAYPAGSLARDVATALDLDFVTTLERAAAKSRHGCHASLSQPAYRVAIRPPAVALVVDDLIVSGTTLQLARQALAAAAVPAFGFAYAAL